MKYLYPRDFKIGMTVYTNYYKANTVIRGKVVGLDENGVYCKIVWDEPWQGKEVYWNMSYKDTWTDELHDGCLP